MHTCPQCHQTDRQNKAGKTQSGSQRIRCMYCGRKYTPEPKRHGYADAVRKQALQLYVDGINLRRIARHLGLHHRTVSLWIKASAANLPALPVPEEVKTAEMDELFTFIGNKKTGFIS
jgi:transposase-like protein